VHNLGPSHQIVVVARHTECLVYHTVENKKDTQSESIRTASNMLCLEQYLHHRLHLYSYSYDPSSECNCRSRPGDRISPARDFPFHNGCWPFELISLAAPFHSDCCLIDCSATGVRQYAAARGTYSPVAVHCILVTEKSESLPE
jgi:hypothetical protein